MLIAPRSLRLDCTLPVCCQARLLSCNHWKLKADAVALVDKMQERSHRQIVLNICTSHASVRVGLDFYNSNETFDHIYFVPRLLSRPPESLQLFSTFLAYFHRSGRGSRTPSGVLIRALFSCLTFKTGAASTPFSQLLLTLLLSIPSTPPSASLCLHFVIRCSRTVPDMCWQLECSLQRQQCMFCSTQTA